MDWHFCCYSASTEIHKLKGQRNYSFAVILNSSVDAEVMGSQKWTSTMPYLTYGNPSLEEEVGTLCQKLYTVIIIY